MKKKKKEMERRAKQRDDDSDLQKFEIISFRRKFRPIVSPRD